jgi:pimeloyl-ACP methyl ester carboxylesterase
MRERYRVVALDQRGHGASERRPADVSCAAYAADVAAVIGALELAGAVLVGQSMGGAIAMLTAAAHPDLVRALVLVEAGVGDPHPETPGRIEWWLAFWPLPFASRAEAAGFFGGGPAGAGWAAGLEEREDGWWPRFEPGVMVRSIEEIGRWDFRPEWDQVGCPALVVRAEAGIVTAEGAREMARRRPGTRVVTVAGAGHDVHLEKPQALRAAITDFLTPPP